MEVLMVIVWKDVDKANQEINLGENITRCRVSLQAWSRKIVHPAQINLESNQFQVFFYALLYMCSP